MSHPRQCLGLGAVIMVLAFSAIGFSPSRPEGETEVVVRGGRFFTPKGWTEGGVLLIRDGKIAAFGKDIAIPRGADVVEASRSFVTPGFIDSLTDLGLEEPGTLGSDADEKTSPVTPQLRIIDAFNPANPFLARARGAGVTAALIAPRIGNLISGQCGLLSLGGEEVTEMTARFPAGVLAALGEAPKMRFGPKNQVPSTRMGSAALLRQTFIDVQGYMARFSAFEEKLRSRAEEGKKPEGEEPSPPAVDLKLQALVPVLRGEVPLIIQADRLDDILTALRIADEFRLKLILSGGAEAYKVKERLAARKIPVVLRPVAADRLTLETQKAIAENAAILSRAGIKLCFQTGSVQDVSGLLRQARIAVAGGLPPDEALRALTSAPAEIFGVADLQGSLERGKSADLAIFGDDPLWGAGRPKMVIIRGKVQEKRRD
jgi:imidazolonepropionase-like amidohydrolase